MTQHPLSSNGTLGTIMSAVRRLAKRDVAEDDSLVRSGLVDSIGVVELIGVIEESFGIEFEGDDLEVENFETVNRLVQLVQRKQAVLKRTA